MNVLLSTGSVKFTCEQIDRIKAIKGVNLFIQDDEREPIDYDISKIEYIISYTLLSRYNVDDFINLKYVQALTQGLEPIPVEKLEKRGISLKRAIGLYSTPIAEFVLLRTLEIYKSARFFDKNQRAKVWKKDRGLRELTDKRIAIVGYGDIGNEVAKRFSAFGSKIISFSRSEKKSPYIDEHYHISKLKSKLSQIDITVVCVPYNKETHNLFDEKMFSNMKKQCVFINIARGQIVNEDDLITYIEKDKFLGVALDVTVNEPLPSDSQLWDYENVFISPHNSFASDVVNKRMYALIYSNLKKTCENESEKI